MNVHARMSINFFIILSFLVYDVGDQVLVNGISLNVKQINLFNTIFSGSSGESVYLSNNTLIAANIQNLFR